MKKKGTAVSTEKVNPVFEKLEQLTKIQRIGIWAGVLVLVVAAFVYFSYLPNFKQIDTLRNKLAKIEKQLEVAKKNARELNAYRKKMQEAEEQFKIVMQALPEKEEIPTLLTGISRAGKESGLEFLLFQPKPERKKDFYAEIPVSIRVEGSYKDTAMFFYRVAGLSRIVNLKNISMAPQAETDLVTTTCNAVTYMFVEGK